MNIPIHDLLQKNFIGTDELRQELSTILSKLRDEGGEIVVTQHGKPQAVLLDLPSYLEMMETIADLVTPGLVESVNKGIKEVKEGKYLTVKDLKKQLKL